MSALTTRSTTHLVREAVRAGPPSVWVKGLGDRMLLAVLVGLAMIGMGLVTGALWPVLQDTVGELEDALGQAATAVAGGASFTTPAGWANAEFLAIVAPAGVIVVAALSGAGATAGEEEDKTLGVLLSAPVSRIRVLLEKAAAVAVHVAVTSALVFAGLVIGSAVGGLGLELTAMLAATAHVAALGLAFGALTLAFGAGLGRRRLSAVAAGGVALASYVVASFFPFSDALEPWARISPWYYYNSHVAVQTGVEWSYLLVLGALAPVLTALAVLLFRRRDLRG